MSFIRMNHAAWTFNFLVASLPSISMLSLKYETIGVVQLPFEPISYTIMPSITSESWTKESTLLEMNMCSADAALARWSAYSFSSLGI